MKNPARQRGAATLIVALVLLVALTLVTFSAARIGVSEQRNSTNAVRAKAALEIAQAGLEQGLAYLNRNNAMIDFTGTDGWASTTVTPTWVPCPAGGTSKAPPCGDGVQPFTPTAPLPGGWLYFSPPGTNMSQIPNSGYTFTVTYLTPADPTGTPRDDLTIVIVSQAISTDGLGGGAIAKLIVRRYGALQNTPIAPIIANGMVDLTGGVNIWGNRSAIPSSPAPGSYNPSVIVGPASTPPAQDGVSYGPTFLASFADPSPPPLPPPPPPPASIITTLATTITTRDGLTTTTTLLGTPLSIWVKDLSPPNGTVEPTEVGISGASATCRNFSPTTTPTSCTGVGGNYTLQVPGPLQGTIEGDIVAGPVVSRREPGNVFCTPFPGTSLAPPYPPPCNNIENDSADLFKYIFGVEDSESSVIENSPGTTLLADCDDLHTLPPGRYWVTGSCTIDAGVTVGDPVTPYLVVVDNAAFTLNGGATFYGLIYSRETTPGAADITLAGGATLIGSLVSDHDISGISGGFKAVYDANVLMSLSRTAGGFTKLSGGWMDGTQ